MLQALTAGYLRHFTKVKPERHFDKIEVKRPFRDTQVFVCMQNSSFCEIDNGVFVPDSSSFNATMLKFNSKTVVSECGATTPTKRLYPTTLTPQAARPWEKFARI